MTPSKTRPPPNSPTKDFPAAHSMDATWFAVDADGCVGVFETGEDGALPTTAASDGANFDTFFFDAARIGRAVASQKDEGAKGDVLQFHSVERWREEDNIQSAPARAIVVLRQLKSPYRGPSIEEAFGDSRWVVVHETRPRVLASRDPISDVLLIAERKDVRAILLEDDLGETLYEASGTFVFGHSSNEDDGYQPGLYVREPSGLPTNPLKLTDVPEDARAHIAKLTLPVRFADTEKIHLADHLKEEDCARWAEETSLRGKPLKKEQGGGAIAKVLGWFRGDNE